MTSQALNRPVDVLAWIDTATVAVGIVGDGYDTSAKRKAKPVRDAVSGLIDAAKEARRVIRLDRASLYSCHYDPKAGDVVDALGIAGLKEYDNALAMLDTALAAIGSQS